MGSDASRGPNPPRRRSGPALALGKGAQFSKRGWWIMSNQDVTFSVDVNELITSTAGRLRRIAGPGIEIDEDLDLTVGRARGNPAELEQAIEDLAANGCDAMPKGGVLTIRT